MTLFSYIKSKLSILEVVLDYVQLKQAGNYWKGSCPFHDEKDASFTVSPDRQIFYCFGCHAGGDVISFISKVENITQIESAWHAVDRYKLSVPQELKRELGRNTESAQEKKNFFQLCEDVAIWCYEQLKLNSRASRYVASRDIKEEAIKYFDVGYFPGGMSNVSRFTKEMTSKGHLIKDLVKAGVIVDNGRVTYSPFEERIVFPIKDLLGRYCGFGGRVFKDHDERAKYYNSKESPYFQKGQLLFGLDLAKKELRDQESAFLVEGYTDCIAMVQHGYKNVVATLGTACTADHLKLLSRYVNTIYVLYDGDAAGQKAILRLIELCWEANLELKIVRLASSDDPASFLGNGGDLDKLVDRADDIFTFFVETEGSSFVRMPLNEKLKLGEKIIKVIARVDDAFKQRLLLQKAASVMQVSLETVKELLDGQRVYAGESEEPRVAENKNHDTLEKKILFAIINNMGDYERFSIEDLSKYFSDGSKAVLNKIESIATNYEPQRRFDVFFEELDERARQSVSLNCLKFGGDVSPAQFQDLVIQFRKQKWRDIVANIKDKMLQAQKNKDTQLLQELTKRFVELKSEMKAKGLI